jgi:hypothetical protein
MLGRGVTRFGWARMIVCRGSCASGSPRARITFAPHAFHRSYFTWRPSRVRPTMFDDQPPRIFVMTWVSVSSPHNLIKCDDAER